LWFLALSNAPHFGSLDAQENSLSQNRAIFGYFLRTEISKIRLNPSSVSWAPIPQVAKDKPIAGRRDVVRSLLICLCFGDRKFLFDCRQLTDDSSTDFRALGSDAAAAARRRRRLSPRRAAPARGRQGRPVARSENFPEMCGEATPASLCPWRWSFYFREIAFRNEDFMAGLLKLTTKSLATF